MKVAAGEETQSMFTRLSDVQKAVIFAVLAVALALVMVPLVTDSFITKVAYMWTPGIAVFGDAPNRLAHAGDFSCRLDIYPPEANKLIILPSLWRR